MSAIMTPLERLAVEADDLDDAAAQAEVDGRPIVAAVCRQLANNVRLAVADPSLLAAMAGQVRAEMDLMNDLAEVLEDDDPTHARQQREVNAALTIQQSTLMQLLDLI